MNTNETKQNEQFDLVNYQYDDYFIEEANQRLRALVGHTVKGNDVDYRSPLFNGAPREKVLNAWQKILEPGLSGMEGLLEFENDLRGKVGSLSIQKPLSERMDDITAYYDCIHLQSRPISDDAIDAVLKEWAPKCGGLRIRSLPTTWDAMKKSTSAGVPTMGKKSQAMKQFGFPHFYTKRRSREEFAISLPKVPNREFGPAAILGWRGQEGGLEPDDVKQRVIWMFPMALSIRELSFYQPLIAAAQASNLVPAWNGNEFVDKSMTELFSSKGKDDAIICTDFTKFDQHFNLDMQDAASKILWELCNDPMKEVWFWEIFPVKYMIPLILDTETMIIGDHGMGSGSGGTNADETVSHKALQYECALRSHSTLNPNSMCLGDDGCLSFPGIDVDAVMSSYTAHGQEMNESKQMVSTSEAVYLRRWYSENYKIDGITRGVYSTYRALGKLMGYERLHDPDEWSAKMEVIRALSIIENVKWHPMRDEFLKFCVKGDDYKLGLAIPGFFDELGTLYESSELAQSFGSYTASDNIGINDWWVVKTLKAMR